MNLTEVLSFLGLDAKTEPCELQQIQIDSRMIKQGDLFIAIPGLSTDGREYVEQAINNGAAAVLVEAPYKINIANSTIPIKIIPQLKTRLPELAAFFYRYPARELKIIGITGTNGKTSCSHYTAQILEANKLHCGIMGTIGNGFFKKLTPAALTTSDCCTVQSQFAAFKQQQAKFVAMEVSSHALTQDRLACTIFDTAVFTNLSQDHLDYHADMQEYFTAKTRLFIDFAPRNCVINLDDPYGVTLLTLIPSTANIITYSVTNIAADIYLVQDQIHTPWGSAQFESPLIGKFNISNVLACIACCGLYGLSLDHILASVKTLEAVPGRMQAAVPKHSSLPTVIIDYAHTPDALIKALQTLREYKPQTLYCIFGCGGDRDRAKRPLMFQAALEYSDKVIITMDNQRTEDPQQIVNDIVAGQLLGPNTTIELDRATAIAHAIAKASGADIVLIAGKGHEDYQIIGTQKQPFSDLLVAQQALELRSEHSWTI